MRTNVVLDDKLVTQALKVSGLHTKRELITTALRELIRNRKRLDIRQIQGKISFSEGYNYKALRKG
jgi:Arc/MetJ family transcription regulator